MSHALGNILEAQNISFAISGKKILRDVSIAIPDIPDHGQSVGFLGPSGCGKTTLAMILAGLLKPTEGEVIIGKTGVRVKEGMVGFVAQDYHTYRDLTVWGNIKQAVVSSKKRRKEALEFSHSLLQRFGLADKLSSFPAELSGGQRQRLAIIQQLSCRGDEEGRLVIMDEPFSGLDLISKAEVCKIINEIAASHTLNTIITITHDVEAALMVSDTLWLMGFERDEAGNAIPGAKILETRDLIGCGLAWQPDIEKLPAFHNLSDEVGQRFKTLK